MPEQTLKQKTAGAILWNLADRLGQQVLVFAVGIIVANLLSVDDYALVGMLAIFSAIANIILESGFSSALIRKQDTTDADYNSVFYFSLVISILLYSILFFSAPLIASFYNQPQLTQLSRVIFLSLPFNSLSLIQTTILNKKVKFKLLAKINLTALLISGVASLLMAFGGMGVWTLVWQPVIISFSRTLLLWTFNHWRPRLTFSFASIKTLSGFASGLLLASLVNAVFTNIYSVLIGKLYPTRDMGLYSQGNRISLIAISTIYSSLQTATYPILTSIQDDRERCLRSYRKIIRFTSFLAFPLMIGLVSIAHPFISLVLKEEWRGCIPFFQLTCLAGIFTILTSVNQNFIKVRGRSDVIFKLEIARTLLIIISILITMHESALIMIAFQAITQLLVYIISIIYIGHFVNYSWIKQLKDIFPYACLSVIMWAVLLLPEYAVESGFLLILIKIIAGAAFYYFSNRLLGSTILNESIEILFKKKKQQI